MVGKEIKFRQKFVQLKEFATKLTKIQDVW